MASDWAEIREMMIAVRGIRRAKKMRKLMLIETGSNVDEHKNVVLGGIVLQEEQALSNIAPLSEALSMQDNGLELSSSTSAAATSRHPWRCARCRASWLG